MIAEREVADDNDVDGSTCGADRSGQADRFSEGEGQRSPRNPSVSNEPAPGAACMASIFDLELNRAVPFLPRFSFDQLP